MFRRDDRDDHKNDEGKIMVDRVRREEARIVELADFATETAKFSLWIAEYQMNEQFKAVFGSAPALPLKDSGNIVQRNATRLDWLTVCPQSNDSEIYIAGNPPYLGGKKLRPEQSYDMDVAGLSKMKQVDYIGCWFVKAANYTEGTK